MVWCHYQQHPPTTMVSNPSPPTQKIYYFKENLYTYIHTYIHTYTHMHACMHTHTHTHTHIHFNDATFVNQHMYVKHVRYYILLNTTWSKKHIKKKYIQNICWKNNEINTGSDLTDRR